MIAVREGQLRIELTDQPTAVERKAAALLAARIERRTGIRVPVAAAESRYTLAIGTSSGPLLEQYRSAHGPEPKPGTDGFHIATEPDASGRMYVVGESGSGVVAGVGQLLRLMRYREGAVEVPRLAMTDAPALPVRGIYFATHFGNFYHVAPLDEIDAVIEDFGLWGGNQLIVWFDMHHFQSFGDPAAQEHLARLKHLGETAQSLGMKFGLGFLANEAYDSSPEDLRADANTGTAHYHRELCPSKPEALKLIGEWQAQVLGAFPRIDFIWSWPYDQGGCACADCAPWGANGFPKASEQLSRLYYERHPEGKFWLSTWLLNQVKARGELAGLLGHVEAQEPQWLDGFVIGTHGDWVPKPLLERPFPERYPLAAFPEISMYHMHPWGEHGANPLPAFCERLADSLRGQIDGGWPYSEGIYEDINKFYWARFFWDPGLATDDILREYAAYYLSPDVTDDAVRLFHLMEQTHARSGWAVASLDGADEEWRLAQSIDERLPGWAQASWRWRILCIRAEIDGVLKGQGSMDLAARHRLRELADELVAIYHAEHTFIRPPPLPKPPDPDNIAFGRPVSVSSCLAGYEGRPAQLVDGVLAQDDGENFWCHDREAEETAHVTVDLGEPTQIREVRLQYRGIHGVFWFVPEDLEFQVSADGQDFRTVARSSAVPVEESPYAADLRSYPIGAEGRYVRVLLGPSQHKGDQYAGTLELTEVEVYAD